MQTPNPPDPDRAQPSLQDDFLILLAHDLRNPLGAISAAVDVLESGGADDATAAEARSIIARQSRGLSHLLNELLDVGRLAAGRTALVRQPLDLAALAQRVQQAAAAGQRLTCRLDSAWTDGDAARLEAVVSRLLANALRSTPGDVALSVRREAGIAVIEVQHGGDSVADGQDVGLSLARRLVELHGGTVAVDASPRGRRVSVRLPAVAAVMAPEADLLPRQRHCNVLLVDDDEHSLAALRAMLEREGHSVSTAADGHEGLSQLLLQRPDVSIVAIGLPGLTGLELARHARAAGYAGRMIALAGASRHGGDADAMVAGFDACLVEPVDRVQLRASIGGS